MTNRRVTGEISCAMAGAILTTPILLDLPRSLPTPPAANATCNCLDCPESARFWLLLPLPPPLRPPRHPDSAVVLPRRCEGVRDPEGPRASRRADLVINSATCAVLNERPQPRASAGKAPRAARVRDLRAIPPRSLPFLLPSAANLVGIKRMGTQRSCLAKKRGTGVMLPEDRRHSLPSTPPPPPAPATASHNSRRRKGIPHRAPFSS
ncbi:uncharacterized protein A4U43_C01F8650 [Asparagus officinalis]|uniref:Uncharacterized protein n=1 Tax=Asparagus officinalis TaxID=4686 RepID=A0A5P1FNP4_ASPOF|nr:uncharacterized protein A4U43_C01F8650 [Asparagus officinalis]